MKSLEKQRDVASVLFLYNLVHGKGPNPTLLEKVRIRISGEKKETFQLRHVHTNHDQNAPLNPLMYLYNHIESLCGEIDKQKDPAANLTSSGTSSGGLSKYYSNRAELLGTSIEPVPQVPEIGGTFLFVGSFFSALVQF